MEPSVLLVEDDDAIGLPLERALGREGYRLVRARDGATAIEHALSGQIDLVVLDLGLPDVDGLEVCRRVRETGSTVPIVMLTARGDELDRVVGLDVGADDYLAKPFSLAELLARIRVQLRRLATTDDQSSRTSATPPEAGATILRVDEAGRRVFVGDVEMALTPKEFDLLRLLSAERDRVVTREYLMDEVWDVNWFGSTKTLDVTIARLRQKLEEHEAPVQIVTIRGVGFRLEQR